MLEYKRFFGPFFLCNEMNSPLNKVCVCVCMFVRVSFFKTTLILIHMGGG